jgi:hypothetical protein
LLKSSQHRLSNMNDDHVLCRLTTRPGYRNTEGKFLAACLDDALLPRHPRHLLRQSRIVCCHARAVARNLDVTLGGCVSRKKKKKRRCRDLRHAITFRDRRDLARVICARLIMSLSQAMLLAQLKHYIVST